MATENHDPTRTCAPATGPWVQTGPGTEPPDKDPTAPKPDVGTGEDPNGTGPALTHQQAWDEAVQRYGTTALSVQSGLAAFRRAHARLSETVARDPRRVNLEPSLLATTAIGTVNAVRGLVDAMKASLPGFDASTLDALADAATGLIFVDAMYRVASKDVDPLPELARRGVEIRDTLYDEAAFLARRGLLAGSHLDGLRANPGYRTIAVDLYALTLLFRQAWDSRKGRGFVTQKDIDEADEVAAAITAAVGKRQHDHQVQQAVAEERTRLFCDVLDRYGLLRRDVTYVRYAQGDADEIAPNPYTPRMRTRTDGPSDPASPADPAAPVDPTHAGTLVAAGQGTTPAEPNAVTGPSEANPFAG